MSKLCFPSLLVDTGYVCLYRGLWLVSLTNKGSLLAYEWFTLLWSIWVWAAGAMRQECSDVWKHSLHLNIVNCLKLETQEKLYLGELNLLSNFVLFHYFTELEGTRKSVLFNIPVKFNNLVEQGLGYRNHRKMRAKRNHRQDFKSWNIQYFKA